MFALQDWAQEDGDDGNIYLYNWSLTLHQDEAIIVTGWDEEGKWAEGYRAGHRAQRGVFPKIMVHDDPMGRKSRTGGSGNIYDCLEMWDEHGVVVQLRLPAEDQGTHHGSCLRVFVFRWCFDGALTS